MQPNLLKDIEEHPSMNPNTDTARGTDSHFASHPQFISVWCETKCCSSPSFTSTVYSLCVYIRSKSTYLYLTSSRHSLLLHPHNTCTCMYVLVLTLPQARSIQQCQLPGEHDWHSLIGWEAHYNKGWDMVTACRKSRCGPLLSEAHTKHLSHTI